MFDNIRVFEIAVESGTTSSDVIDKAKNLGIDLKSPQSAVTFEDAEEIVNYIMTGKSKRLKKAPAKKKIIKRVEEPKVEAQSTTQEDSKKQEVAPKEDKKTKKKLADITTIRKVLLKEIEKEEPVDAPKKMEEETQVKIAVPRRTGGIRFVKKKRPLDQFPNIKIEITNLKSIKLFEWELKKEKGIQVIIAENGIGKSSLLSCIAKIIEPNIFRDEFKGKGYEKAKVKYTFDDKVIIWEKNPAWQTFNRNASDMIKLEGFCELSILTGVRFKSVDKHTEEELEIDPAIDKLELANSFIRENMDYILYGDKRNNYKFDNLYFVSTIKNKIAYNWYALKYDDLYIKEFFFSTGEYFLLQLLKFINDLVDKEVSKIPKLVIFDEIELSLHPLAQQRLIEKIKEFSDDYNLIIIIATHSLHIIDNVKPNEIIYLEKQINGNHKISTPIFPAYLTSKLYKHTYYDKIFLVEDVLAKYYLEKLFEELNFYQLKQRYTILPIGGYQKVLETAVENMTSKFYGDAKVMVLLDDDKKGEFSKQRIYKQLCSGWIPVNLNIETYLLLELYNCNDDLIEYINKLCPGEYDYNGFNIVLPDFNKEAKSEEIKNAYHKLIKSLVNIKTVFNYKNDYYEKSLVQYTYNQLKNNSDNIRFKKRIEEFMLDDK